MVRSLSQIACSWFLGLFWAVYNAPPLVIEGYTVPNVLAINSDFSAETEFLVFVHFLSKILDFCDTIFIVLRKKNTQLSFLHLYHHSTIISIWGYLLHLGYGSGAASFGAFINSAVHVLMYTHYLITTFGVENPLKHLLTKVQIFQFYTCIFQATVACFTDLETVYPKYLGWVEFAYHCTMIALFSNFLQRSRTRSKKHAE